MNLEWGPNWEDDLAGGHITGLQDPNVKKMEESIKTEFEDVFMMYLPRICEHCINPSCVSSCPSGAMYKREEDGIVLVDQNACRSWRHCVSSCPYKKCISTGRRTRRKNAHCASLVLKQDCRQSALRHASAESAISESCFMMQIKSKKRLQPKMKKIYITPSWKFSLIRMIPLSQKKQKLKAFRWSGSKQRKISNLQNDH